MKEELITRVVTKRAATKPGCCMWSPILPPDRSSATDVLFARTSSEESTDSNNVRPDTVPSNDLAEVALEL